MNTKKIGGTNQMQLTFGDRVRATIIGGGASIILATAALAAPALAADQPTAAAATDVIGAHTHQLHGVVKTAASAGGTSFVLTTERYGDVTVSFSAHTLRGHGQTHGKARSHELASLADLKVGERVVVQGHTLVSGTTLTFVARRVHVLPAANGEGHRATHLVGNVSGTTATTLSVKLADQTIQTVTVSADTKIRPQGKTLADLTTGTKVTVVVKDGTATAIAVTT